MNGAPLQLAIMGHPNAGKSSVVATLTENDRIASSASRLASRHSIQNATGAKSATLTIAAICSPSVSRMTYSSGS